VSCVFRAPLHHEGTEILPVAEAGQIVKLSIEHGKWMPYQDV
jgi:hypothetical protein